MLEKLKSWGKVVKKLQQTPLLFVHGILDRMKQYNTKSIYKQHNTKPIYK